MISKVISPGKSFAGVCRYLCADSTRCEVILSFGLRDYDYRLMARDFELQRSQNAGLKLPVQHIILSYYPGETVRKELMAQIAQEYLQVIGVKNTQFLVVKHNDRDHLHTHIIFNRVNNDGATISDSFLGLRGKKAAQVLTEKYGLRPAIGKDADLTHIERLNRYEATKYEIFLAVTELLPTCRDLSQLRYRLGLLKIKIIFKYKGQSEEIQGLSFQKGSFKFKGSEIGREYSYGRILNRLGQNIAMKQKVLNSADGIIQQLNEHHQSNLIDALLKPELGLNNLPYDLQPKKAKRKYKRPGM